MIRNTFVKVNSPSHGREIVEAFINLGAKNSRDLVVGNVGHYVGVIFDTLTCMHIHEVLELKGRKVITTLEDLRKTHSDAYKPIKSDRYKDGLKDGFELAMNIYGIK